MTVKLHHPIDQQTIKYSEKVSCKILNTILPDYELIGVIDYE